MVARTTLRMKLYEALADQLTDIVVNSTRFINEMQEMTQRASEQVTPSPDELDVWSNVAEVKKGKIYGLGIESIVVAGRSQYHGSSSSSSDWVRRDELEELRSEEGETLEREMMQSMNFQSSQTFLVTDGAKED